MKRVRRWNRLMWGDLGGQPMPPRAKMDARWRQKFGEESIQQGLSVETQRAAHDHIIRAAIAACKLVGRNQAAMLLLLTAEGMAEPGRAGRPSGSWGYGLAELNVMMNTILKKEDGSPRGRTKAITSVLAGIPAQHRGGFAIGSSAICQHWMQTKTGPDFASPIQRRYVVNRCPLRPASGLEGT